MGDRSADRWKIKERSFTETKSDHSFNKPKTIKRTLNEKAPATAPTKNKTKMLIKKQQPKPDQLPRGSIPVKRHSSYAHLSARHQLKGSADIKSQGQKSQYKTAIKRRSEKTFTNKPMQRTYRRRSGDQNFSAGSRKSKDIDLKDSKQRKRATKQFTAVGAKNKTYYNKGQALRDSEATVIIHRNKPMRIRDQYYQKPKSAAARYQDKHKSRFVNEAETQKLQKKKSRIQQTSKRVLHKTAHDKMEEYGDQNIGVRAAHRTEQAAETNIKLARKTIKYGRQANRSVKQNRLYRKDYQEYKSQLYEKQRLHEKAGDAQAAPKKKPIDIQKRLNKKKMYYRVQVQHKMAEIQEVVQKRGFRLLLDAVKQIVIRNKVLIVGFILVMIFTLICCGVTIALTGALALLETTTYNADRTELDKIVEYITEKDAETIDMFEHMGDSYDRYTLKYEGTGQIATSPMQMLSYINVLLKDQFDLNKAKPPIDAMYLLMYSYTRRVTNDGTADAPIWHLWVTVDCKTVTEVIDENNMFNDFDRKWYDILNQTGGNYLVGNLGNPFPGIDWTGNITDKYGFRVHPVTGKHSFHTGLDIAMGEGSAIAAVHNGTIITATYGDPIWGNYVEIDDGTTKTKYAHCSELNVNVGDIVKTGDIIGFVGSTGQSTGSHLHIEVVISGQRYDPAMQLSRN